MAVRLDAGSADFEARFAALLAMKRETAADVDGQVADIIADVRRRGDEALLDHTSRFDRLDLDPARLRISADEIEAAAGAGRRWNRPVSMCRAGRPPIRAPCS